MTTIDFRQVEVADVYKGDAMAGTLRREADSVVFSYDSEYLANGGSPIATTIPATTRAVRSEGGAVPPFFAGLLPEGRRLSAVQAAIKTSPDDEFSLLVAVGSDCVGDVRILPSGEPARSAAPGPKLPASTDVEFRELFADSLASPLLDRAVAGVQDKLSDSMISIPVVGRRGPAIVKLTPGAFPLLVENESYFLTVARACGIKTPKHQLIHDRRGESALVIQRFDRTLGSRSREPERIPQEDSVQLAGRYPSYKSRMTTREVFDAVAKVVAAPQVELMKLVRLFAFSYTIGNGDLHGKNVSVYRPLGLWQVTPGYDLVSTIPYGDQSMTLSLEGRQDNIRGTDFVSLASRHGLEEKAVRKTLVHIQNACLDAIGGLGRIGFDDRKVAFLSATIARRVEDLNR